MLGSLFELKTGLGGSHKVEAGFGEDFFGILFFFAKLAFFNVVSNVCFFTFV